MAENKTRTTNADPVAFIEGLEHTTRREDARILLALMERVTRCPPKMWGPTIVGFGRYRYRYDSGREGEHLMTGFSPRKAHLVLYVMPGYDDLADQLDHLGKYRIGKSCLYINKLADIDLGVLERIVTTGFATMRARHDTFDE